jgi:hypothetical protein
MKELADRMTQQALDAMGGDPVAIATSALAVDAPRVVGPAKASVVAKP